MEYIKLDHIESEVKAQRFKIFLKLYAGEIFRFGVFAAFMTISGIIFVNRNAFKMYGADILGINIDSQQSKPVQKLLSKNSSQKAQIIQATSKTFDEKQEKYLDIIDSKFSNLSIKDEKSLYQPDISKSLKNKLRTYKFDFNLLPPDNRIMIPELGIDAPIVDINPSDFEKIQKADYDSDLYKGVVRYPDTTLPGKDGNALIFGHTSYYWWKKNPYGEVFSKIPRLTNGSLIQILREGKLYEYEVIDKTVVAPKDVSNTYHEYKNGKYLSIMGCYPIGTDARRMIITAALKTQKTLSYNK